MTEPRLTLAEYGASLAEGLPPITDQQVEETARILYEAWIEEFRESPS